MTEKLLVQCLHCGHSYKVEKVPKGGFLCTKCTYLEELRKKLGK